jgi:hypothetical protein
MVAATHPLHSPPTLSPASVHPLGARTPHAATLRPSLSRAMRSRWRFINVRPLRFSTHQPVMTATTPSMSTNRNGMALAQPSESRSLTQGCAIGIVLAIPRPLLVERDVVRPAQPQPPWGRAGRHIADEAWSPPGMPTRSSRDRDRSGISRTGGHRWPNGGWLRFNGEPAPSPTGGGDGAGSGQFASQPARCAGQRRRSSTPGNEAR